MITWVVSSQWRGGLTCPCVVRRRLSMASRSAQQEEAPGTSGKTIKSKKICGVCGDKAKSYHFGGISCDSCKAFFRRSVQNDAHQTFHCPYDSKCQININSRKCCQFCRFQKCVEIGMEKTWVMTEEERLVLLRQRMERKKEPRASKASSVPSDVPSTVEDHSRYMSEADAKVVQDLICKYHACVERLPYDKSLQEAEDRPVVDLVSMFTTTIQRMTHFAGSLDIFQRLSKDDQTVLLRSGMIEMCIVRGAYAYDPLGRCWPNRNLPLYQSSPAAIREEDLRKLFSPELYRLHMKFNDDLRKLNVDEATYMLLLLVVLFSPDRPSLEDPTLVSEVQDFYLTLLRNHLNTQHPIDVAAKLYPKLLLKFPDLREVNDAHTEHHLQLSDDDVRHIQQQFGNILYNYHSEGSGSTSTLQTLSVSSSSHPTTTSARNGKSSQSLAAEGSPSVKQKNISS